MKILCPTDFSNVSYNAIHWAYELAKNHDDAEIEILHCLPVSRSLGAPSPSSAVAIERANRDLDYLKRQLQPHRSQYPKVNTSLIDEDPKKGIAKQAVLSQADLVVMGSSGLTAYKEIVFGSVTDTVARNSAIPVLIIPPDHLYRDAEQIVLGLGTEYLLFSDRISILARIWNFCRPRIHVTQVVKPGKEKYSTLENEISSLLVDLSVQFNYIDLDDKVINALNLFSDEVSADIVCLIHQKRGLLGSLLQPSMTTAEIERLVRPILIIPDQPIPAK